MAAMPTVSQANEAAAWMASEVHTPAFFDKLASYGIRPRTQAEADQLMQLGAVLQQAEFDGRYKSASVAAQEQANPFLSHVLGRLASTTQPTSVQVDASIKQAALKVASLDPIAKTAALVYNYALNGGELAAEPQA
jgi:hypothetical protein